MVVGIRASMLAVYKKGKITIIHTHNNSIFSFKGEGYKLLFMIMFSSEFADYFCGVSKDSPSNHFNSSSLMRLLGMKREIGWLFLIADLNIHWIRPDKA